MCEHKCGLCDKFWDCPDEEAIRRRQETLRANQKVVGKLKNPEVRQSLKDNAFSVRKTT